MLNNSSPKNTDGFSYIIFRIQARRCLPPRANKIDNGSLGDILVLRISLKIYAQHAWPLSYGKNIDITSSVYMITCGANDEATPKNMLTYIIRIHCERLI